MIKYASLEGAETLEIKSSPTRVKNASLERISDFNDYRIDDGYLYVRLRAQSSRINKNHDGWPTIEMAGGKEAWDKISSQHTSSEGFTIHANKDAKQGFSTFLGKPSFVDHHNTNPDRARGVVVDSKFRVIDSKTASQDDYWKQADVDPEHLPASEIELLVEIDAKSFPRYAKAIVDGDIDGWSMGCDVDYSKCSHCGHEASSPDEYCSHIISKGAHHDYTSSEGKKISKKSYENCYGVHYFEISGVFDPADDTALSREVKAAVEKEAIGIPAPGAPDPTKNLFDPTIEEIQAEAARMEANGVAPAIALELASKKLRAEKNDAWGQAKPNEGAPYEPKMTDYTTPPAGLNMQQPLNSPMYSSVKTAQPEEPQEFHTKAPEEVDTHRQERVCPLCGSDMEGDQCDVCGYEEPPEQLQNPDLHKDEGADELGDQAQIQQEIPNPDPVPPPEPHPEAQATQTRNPQPTSSINSEMNWEPRTSSAPKPSGDEPNETVTSDQTTPVTSAMRTARDLIASASKRNQEKNMANERTAAEPLPDAKADKRVDVEGVGGVTQATNEEASKPEGAHSWEPKGVTVDVQGKGGVLEDSNAEASRPSVGTESLPASDTDNAGFDKKKTTDDSGPTKTFDNSNEPGSAVTDKAFPTASAHEAGDDRPFPHGEDTAGGGSAKKGTDPVDAVGKADERVDVLKPATDTSNNSGPTTQWTGTDGNGVTKQQNPVTDKPTQSGGIKASGLISLAALKLADSEVELGLISKDEKYNRLAELAELDETEIAAEHRALAKVKTAGLTRTASAGGTRRLPSFRRVATDETEEAQPVDDALLDNALFN